jgi:outer membrane protein assembly factor BamB
LIVEGGGVFAVAFQGKVGVADQVNGRQYWAKEMSSAQVISASGGRLFVADDNGVVWSVDQRTGSIIWKQDKLYGRRLTGTAVQGELVAVGDFEGYLHWMNTDDGTLLARKRHDRDGFAGTPVSFDDTLYVLSYDGKLAAYGLRQK